MPDAWNGGVFVADTLQKAGSGSYFQGASLTSFTALGGVNGVGYKEDGTAGFQGTEAVIRDLDADLVYTSAPDFLVDGDGSTTSGPGSVDPAIDIGGVLVPMRDNVAQGNRAVCTNSLTAPTAVRRDTDGNCTNGGGTNGTYILGTSATPATIEVTAAWTFASATAMGGDGDTNYDLGEDIFIENFAGELTYSASADANVYTTAGMTAGNPLANFAADCDGAGAGTQACKFTGTAPIDASRSIYIDQGTAGGAAPNNVLDRQQDQLTGLGIQNNGTAVNATDIAAVKVWRESGGTSGFQSATDVFLGVMSVNSVNDKEWRINGLTEIIAIGGTRFYVTVDTAAGPTNNSTLQMLIPVYTDAGGDGVATQNGDVGIFVASANDGPTDAIVLNQALQVIDTVAPVLTQFTPVPTPTNDTTPDYSFTSSEAGTLTYGGDCASVTTAATAGLNTVTFNSLSAGDHSNCTILATDSAGNVSLQLTVSTFTIDLTPPTAAEVTPVPTFTNDNTPDYTFSTSEAGTVTYGGDCASSTLSVPLGNSTITLNPLGQGLHNNCTLRVTDVAGNPGNVLALSPFTVDLDAPVISETMPVPLVTNNQTPSYTFESNEAGTISYGGSCSGTTTAATSGSNTIIFNSLPDGLYNNCTLRVTDPATNQSNLLSVSAFTVHTERPFITNVTSTNSNGSHYPGENILIAVTFDENVFVTGVPRILLETGDADEYAIFVSGSGTSTLIFDYHILVGNTSEDLSYIDANSFELNGGAINDYASNQALLTLPVPGSPGSLSANKDLRILPAAPDTTAPRVNDVFSLTANGSYAQGQTITLQLHWSENVVVSGDPQLTLNTSPTPAVATYQSGSGGHMLIFTFSVGPDMRTYDLDYANTGSLSLSGGSIKDFANNDADLTLPVPGEIGSLSANSNIIIDSITPLISETTPILTFTNDSTPDYVFTSDEPGTIIYGGGCSSVINTAIIGANVITFNSLADGTYGACTIRLRDSAGNLSAILNVSPFTVNTTIPRAINITSSNSNGLYGRNAAINIQISFDEVIEVTGTPKLILETGSTDAMASYQSGSGSTTLVFGYTVATGENAARLDYRDSSSLIFNGGTIEDQANNSATLSLPEPGAAGSLSANKNLEIHTVPPVLFEAIPIYTPTTDSTPTYTFNSSEDGTITYSGPCASDTTTAVVGDNSITFRTLPYGNYNTCQLIVTDPAGNVSSSLSISAFTIRPRPSSPGVLLIQSLHIQTFANPESLAAEGQEVTYRYQVTNNGTEHLHNVVVTDSACKPVVYNGGDVDADGALDFNEVWEFSCLATLDTSTRSTATAVAEQSGRSIQDTSEIFVPVAEDNVPAAISLEKTVIPNVVPTPGGEVIFTYKVSNPATTHLENIQLIDELCAPLNYLGGDNDNDKRLDFDETWLYSCTKTISTPITNKAFVIAVSSRGQQVSDEATVSISVGQPGEDIHPGDELEPGVERLAQLGLPVHALVKTMDSSTVFYLAADGLAHPFFNAKTFFSWYCDFNDVKLIADSLLAQVPLGAYVNYAPGSLIKVPENPMVYAVSGDSVLHWIENELVAAEIYGEAWNRLIYDVASLDGYTLGNDFKQKSDFDPTAVRQAVTFPSDIMDIVDYTPSLPGEGLVCEDQ